MKSTILPALAGALGTFVVLHFLSGSSSHAAGSLNPPAGPPKPEMVSLSELSAQIQGVQSRLDAQLPGGRNLAIAGHSGSVAAWDHETDTWYPFQLGRVVGPMTESNGNFLFLSSQGRVAAWSSHTKKWSSIIFQGIVIHSAGSNGNFFVATNRGNLAAWNAKTGTWTRETFSNLVSSHKTSEGNIIYTDTRGTTAVWNQETSKWTKRAFGSFLIPVGSD